MSEPLTRELVLEKLYCKGLVVDREQLADHDAAQRARIAALEQQLASLTQERDSLQDQWRLATKLDSDLEDIVSLSQQVADLMVKIADCRREVNEALDRNNAVHAELASMGQERDLLNRDNHTLRERVEMLERELEQEHTEILVCTECGRTSKHGWIGIVYESTPNSAEEYDTKCPECGSMRLDENAHSLVYALDTAQSTIADLTAQLAAKEADVLRATAIIHGLLPLDEIDAADIAWAKAMLKEQS